MGSDLRRASFQLLLVCLIDMNLFCRGSYSYLVKFYRFMLVHKISTRVVCINGEHLSHFVRSLDLTLSYNGGQKNLGLRERNSSVDSAPKDNFLFGLGSSRRSPTSPSNVVAQKSTHFHPFCSKSNFVWGGRGGVASFSNITGKVPTLLTSIVGI